MLENDLATTVLRLEKTFSNRRYVRALANPKNAWKDVPVTGGVFDNLKGL